MPALGITLMAMAVVFALVVHDTDAVLTDDDLVQGENVFVAATGVTSGALLRGVRVVGDRVETESIVMRSRSGTFRRIVASHPLTKIQSLMKGAR